MLRHLLFAIALMFALAPSALWATNPAFDPHWQVGDTWAVRFSVHLHSVPMTRDAQPPATTDISYVYRVVDKKIENGRNVFKIQARPAMPGWPEWLLTFDADELTLGTVEELGAAGGEIAYANPFGRDAWLAKLDQYNEMVILDFPKIPDTSTNQVRQLAAPQSSTPPFTQTVDFQGGVARAVLQRGDPASNLRHTTTIEWRPGRKWWTTASTTLGSDVVVSGQLM
jgi:hypothetical protein